MLQLEWDVQTTLLRVLVWETLANYQMSETNNHAGQTSHVLPQKG